MESRTGIRERVTGEQGRWQDVSLSTEARPVLSIPTGMLEVVVQGEEHKSGVEEAEAVEERQPESA